MRNLARALGGLMLITASACGGGDHHGPPIFTAQITSDQPADGDVAFDPVTNVFTVTPAAANQDVLYGLDNGVADVPEYRAFLDFPLDGSTGDAPVPPGARIRSGTLEIFIQATDFSSTIPSLLELVPYPTTGPRDTDYDARPISSQAFTVFASDQGAFLDLDVSALVDDALAQGLRDFQVRLTLDPSANLGLVQIADGILNEAPLLVVDYTDR